MPSFRAVKQMSAHNNWWDLNPHSRINSTGDLPQLLCLIVLVFPNCHQGFKLLSQALKNHPATDKSPKIKTWGGRVT